MSEVIKLTQQELANALCLVLTTIGIVISVASLLPVQFLDKENAQQLGEKFFTSGITLGFGVSSVEKLKRKRQGKERMEVEEGEGESGDKKTDYFV